MTHPRATALRAAVDLIAAGGSPSTLIDLALEIADELDSRSRRVVDATWSVLAGRTVDAVLAAAAGHAGVTVDAIRGTSRHARSVYGRRLAALALRIALDGTAYGTDEAIGRHLRRHRTSVASLLTGVDPATVDLAVRIASDAVNAAVDGVFKPG